MKLVEITTPHRCCGRCGISWSEYLKDKDSFQQCYTPYGALFYKHVWIWWDPNGN